LQLYPQLGFSPLLLVFLSDRKFKVPQKVGEVPQKVGEVPQKVGEVPQKNKGGKTPVNLLNLPH